MKTDWVTAGACAGFILLAFVALAAGVEAGQILLRGGVGALVGAFIGFGITKLPAPPPPAAPTMSWKPQVIEEEEDGELESH